MTKVIIAEKPSVAREIASIVGATTKADGYIYGNGYSVTWALGHLVQLAMPESYGAIGFRREHLPITPESFKLTPRQVRSDKGYKDDIGAVKQLRIIKKLFDSCSSIIVATDAGREGELIFRFIYHYLGCNKPFQRLWISSLTDTAIREGLNNIKDGAHYDNLYLSAKARSEADWLIGINATQALSVAASEGVYSLGRVQTPTLMMVCSRYLENRDFKSVPYWQVSATIEKDGVSLSLLSEEKFTTKGQADEVSWQLMDSGRLTIETITTKQVTEQPPLLYDLTTLQKDMNKTHGFSADKTLSLAQKLYEAKYITYPRTGSRYISEDMVSMLSVEVLNRNCIDGSKVTDHHAILPTSNTPHNLSADEQSVYDAIVKRMEEAFLEPCIKETTTITAEGFSATSTIIKIAGWRKKSNDEIVKLPQLQEGESVNVISGEVLQKSTKPKAIHTESSLLSAMESAGKELDNEEERRAMKECGIGTPATRASIIETLFARCYIIREGRKLIPTEKGLAVYNIVKDKKVADIQMTGMWEDALSKIERGEMVANTFSEGIKILTAQITRELLEVKIATTKAQECTCPKCGKTSVTLYSKIAKCKECDFVVFRTISEKYISDNSIKELLTQKETSIIKGFKSKAGKRFDAKLFLDDNNLVKFKFSDRKK